MKVTKKEDSMEDIPLEETAGPKKKALQEAIDDGSNKDQTKDGLNGGEKDDKSNKKTGRDLGVWDASLEDSANCLSDWLLSYLTPFLKVGANKVIDEDDVGIPSKEDRADAAYAAALKAWEVQAKKSADVNAKRQQAYDAKLAKCSTDEQRNKIKPPKLDEPSIASALVKSFGVWRVLWAIFLYIISALLTFIPVLILNDLVRFFQAGESVAEFDGVWFKHPWVEVVALGVLPVAISLLQTRNQVIMAHCAVYVRTAVSTLLYRKSLRISAAGRAKTSTGQVVNMMSNDTTQLQRFLQFAGMTLVAPFQIIISLVLIYGQVGNATWVGVGFMLFLAPVNTVVFSVVSKMRRRVLKYSDMRVKMMNEILGGIRIIKFYAWERPFGKEVDKIRENELDALTKLAYVSAVGFSLILLSAPIIQPILVFLTYVSIQDEPLDAATAFTTVALFNIMRFPFAFMPMGLLQYIQSKISLRRLERYLQLPELVEYVIADDESAEGSIIVKNGTFSWVDPDAAPIKPIQHEKKKKKKKKRRSSSAGNGDSDITSNVDSEMRDTIHSLASTTSSEISRGPTITLQDINFSIEPGMLVAVVGPVGSGKSSLLSAILGEMEPLNDSKVHIPQSEASKSTSGFVSYCSQSPWVVNDTLRGNIIFGREYDEQRYKKIIELCALVDDFAILPAGDMTEIGERGINLSGGQKARVSLARAMYAKSTKILLLDDPLSAVDSHVGEHLFAKAIAGEETKNTTRVLVTHHVHFLPRCDKVIVMNQGRIEHQGTYADLIAQGVDFAGAVDASKHANDESNDEKATKKESSIVDEDDKAAIIDKDKTAAEVKDEETEGKNESSMRAKGEKLVSTEEREEGSVAGSAYIIYAKAGGLIAWFTAITVQGIGRGSEVGSTFWLSYWAAQSLNATMNGNPHTASDTYYYVGIYALFGMVGVLGLTIRSLALAYHRLGASRKLNSDLTKSILRAPVAFFDVTPIGRILNRFAADMDKVDLELTQSLGQAFSTVFNVLGGVGAIVFATKGSFLVPLIPLGWAYYLIQKWFRRTSTALQRVTSVLNSPIFADFSQTLSGTSTIRAYEEEDRFFKQCQSSFDSMNAAYLLTQLTNYWLGLRLDIMGGLIGAFVGGIAVATSSANFIPAGWLGLALSYSIEVTGFLKFGVRMIATIEAQMNSVERILYYSENVEPEGPEFVPEKDPPEGTWPSKGEIEIKNASMRYRNGPLVLKDISLKVKGGEKIGVVGRTGSGKSSLMIVLFRISEIEKDGGQILIDGVDTAEIGTEALRLNLSIIPQDPVMFSNTVRYNLDPFGTKSDQELWDALIKVQLGQAVASLEKGLDEEVSEGGENFSQGQRQLLCIARSLLRNPSVLVMDEATASIDNETDALIQTMIRENFKDATILTIAHRLNTIMDSDRVLVLDDGRVAEFDSPEALLQKKDSIFKSMVEETRESNDK
jgi:ATP-binding cassette subfamily C (CFTR/MRP) protein 1